MDAEEDVKENPEEDEDEETEEEKEENAEENVEEHLGGQQLDLREVCEVTGEVRAPGDTPGLKGMEGQGGWSRPRRRVLGLFC